MDEPAEGEKEDSDSRLEGGLVVCVNRVHKTNLILRLLQLSQARCVFVLFLASAWEAAVLAAVARPVSPVESVVAHELARPSTKA